MTESRSRSRPLTWLLVAAAAALPAACGEESTSPAEPASAPAPQSQRPASDDAWAGYQAASAALGRVKFPGIAAVDITASPPRIVPAAAASGVSWPQVANDLAAAEPAVRQLMEAAVAEHVSLPKDAATSTHLSEFRHLARLLRVDAARVMSSGDADGAVARLAAIIGMARHLAQQAEGNHSLVAMAIFTLGEGGVNTLFGDASADRLSPAQKARFAGELDRLSADDPFGAAASGAPYAANIKDALTRLRSRVGAR